MIKESTLDELDEILCEIVYEAEGTWREKKDQILEQLGPQANDALQEFVEWFDEPTNE